MLLCVMVYPKERRGKIFARVTLAVGLAKLCRDSVPQGRRKTATFLAVLRCTGLTDPLIVDGAMNGSIFLSRDHRNSYRHCVLAKS